MPLLPENSEYLGQKGNNVWNSVQNIPPNWTDLVVTSSSKSHFLDASRLHLEQLNAPPKNSIRKF